MNILFIHQNFPGQFKFLAPALVAQDRCSHHPEPNLTLTRQDELITFVNRKLEPYRGYHWSCAPYPRYCANAPRRGLRHCGQRHPALQ